MPQTQQFVINIKRRLPTRLPTRLPVRIPTLLLAGVLAGSLAACSLFGQETPNQAPQGQGQQVDANGTPIVGGQRIQRALPTPLPTRIVVTDTAVTVDGVVALSVPTTTLGFEQTGKVVSVNVTTGQAVKKGDVLATVDETSLQDAVTDAQLQVQLVEAQIKTQASTTTKEELAAARAALVSANANYSVTAAGAGQSEIDTAKRSLDAAWLGYLGAQSSRDTHCGTPAGLEATECKLQEASYGTAFENWVSALKAYNKLLEPVGEDALAQAQANVTSAQAKIASLGNTVTAQAKKLAETQYSQAQTALERAQNNLAKAKLVSPCDCIVQTVNVAEGVVAPSSAFALVDLSKLQFTTTNLSESDVAQIKPGATVVVRLKSYEQTFTGKVNTILSQSSGTQSGTALFTAIIDLDPTDQMLLPGMTGQAEISIS